MAAAETITFEVLDVLGGTAALVKPNATLDGSVHLRAAQACSPLLDGNRFGFQVELNQPLIFERTLTGVRLASMPEGLRRAVSGSMPRVFAEGLLDPRGGWARPLARGLAFREAKSRRRISLFTGLLVRPRPGFCLRLGHAGNRRNISFEVEERWFADSDAFAPLIVTMTFQADTPFPATIFGELATLAPFTSNCRFKPAPRAEVERLGHAHTSFFDAEYFAQKKSGSTRKYRRLVSSLDEVAAASTPSAHFAALGPACLEQRTEKTFVTASGLQEAPPNTPTIESLDFHNALSLSCHFDGNHANVEPDKAALERFSRETRSAWLEVFGAEHLERCRGALWYFSKYITPHQAGEPYFFVKPPALLSTPPGYSSLIEGVPGPGYTVLRGVVHTDVFHAAPAVIRIDHPLRRIEIPAKVLLMKIIPFPRWLLEAKFATLEWPHGPRVSRAMT